MVIYSAEQLRWIDAIDFPQRLLLVNATEFDDQFLILTSDWRYRLQVKTKAILFASGRSFSSLSSSSINDQISDSRIY